MLINNPILLRKATEKAVVVDNARSDFWFDADEFIYVKSSGALLGKYRLWLKSRKGDYIRDPERGGFFDDRLRRFGMDTDSERNVENALAEATSKDFPEINLLKCEAHVDRVARGWTVEIEPLDTQTHVVGRSDDANLQKVTISQVADTLVPQENA